MSVVAVWDDIVALCERMKVETTISSHEDCLKMRAESRIELEEPDALELLTELFGENTLNMDRWDIYPLHCAGFIYAVPVVIVPRTHQRWVSLFAGNRQMRISRLTVS